MTHPSIASGTVHRIPADLRRAILNHPRVLAAWQGLTPLARNEWICWTLSVRRPATRKQHIERLAGELIRGKRRPCCWIGCTHRNDKKASPSQEYILSQRIHKRT